MTESEYLAATNLAKLRIADQALRDIMAGYGPIDDAWLRTVVKMTSDKLDECFAAIKTDDVFLTLEAER